ncbi:MAG: hypothetical protein SPI87_12290 [Anaerobutyricum sp.]|nr:hypothetical protein [Eubacterium sp.]MDY6047772.1 hypothetical protein [Anaerobutyricum sp.]
MQAVVETIFDLGYLVAVISIGILMIIKSKENRQFRLFGIMAVVLGLGDSFHLVPRVVALCTTGLENHVVALGFGKLVTSITMTIFYVLMYHIWRIRYEVKGQKELTITVYGLAIIRILLCLCPQNQWLSANAPISWGIYRNIPFSILGLLMIILYYKKAKEHGDTSFRFIWLGILLSFGFYLPVVLWADSIPIIGMLMLPKTCAYLWMVVTGYRTMKQELC